MQKQGAILKLLAVFVLLFGAISAGIAALIWMAWKPETQMEVAGFVAISGSIAFVIVVGGIITLIKGALSKMQMGGMMGQMGPGGFPRQ